MREPLLRLAARYLLEAKRGDGAPRDAVARFHLGNGATIERLDWLADPTPRGLEQSFGIMVNYRYALDRYAANQLAYGRATPSTRTSAVKALAAADPTVLGEPVADGFSPQRAAGGGTRRAVAREAHRRPRPGRRVNVISA